MLRNTAALLLSLPSGLPTWLPVVRRGDARR